MRPLFLTPNKHNYANVLRGNTVRFASSTHTRVAQIRSDNLETTPLKTSKSPSGLLFASTDTDARVVTLGVQIAAGSARENDENAGISHLFSKMAFRSTQERSDLRLFRDIESIGGFVHKECDRTSVRYYITVLPDRIENAATILAETTLAPRFAIWDIRAMKSQVQVDVEHSLNDDFSYVMEGLHAAAFYDEALLGRPKYSLDNLERFDSEDLWKFHEQYVTQSSLAVMGCGIQHDELRDLAGAYFSELPSGKFQKLLVPRYVGGESRVKKASASYTFVALGFQTVGKHSKEYKASMVLKALLGARLGQTTANSFLTGYDDVNLFGFAGYAAREEAKVMVENFAREIKKAASTACTSEELLAAQNIAAMHQYQTLSNRTTRMALLGTAALDQRPWNLPQTFTDVSSEAVQKIAKEALKSTPSLSSVGNLSHVPRLEIIVQLLQ